MTCTFYWFIFWFCNSFFTLFDRMNRLFLYELVLLAFFNCIICKVKNNSKADKNVCPKQSGGASRFNTSKKLSYEGKPVKFQQVFTDESLFLIDWLIENSLTKCVSNVNWNVSLRFWWCYKCPELYGGHEQHFEIRDLRRNNQVDFLFVIVISGILG